MDRSGGASVEDVGQEESNRGLYRKIARPLRRVSENKSTRIESDPLQEAESEEMTAPGPPWTPEEDGLLRSMGAAGESATAIATLLKRKAGGAPACSPTRDQVSPFAARAEAKVEITSPDTKALGDARRPGNPDLCRLPDIT